MTDEQKTELINEIHELEEKLNFNAFKGKELTQEAIRKFNKFCESLNKDFGTARVTYLNGSKKDFTGREWISHGERILTNLKVEVERIKP